MGIFLGGNCPGGIVRGELSGGGGIFQGGIFPATLVVTRIHRELALTPTNVHWWGVVS